MRIALLVLGFFLAACSPSNGTGTGNPVAPGPIGESLGSSQIFGDICALVQNCNATVTAEDCTNGVGMLTGFAVKLGVDAVPLATALTIMILESEHRISPVVPVLNECVAKLTALNCSDPAVLGAYDPTNMTTPFAGTVNLLDPVCAGVFAP